MANELEPPFDPPTGFAGESESDVQNPMAPLPPSSTGEDEFDPDDLPPVPPPIFVRTVTVRFYEAGRLEPLPFPDDDE